MTSSRPRLSFGQDPRWRRALVGEVAPAPGERVLDVATGTGLVAAELIKQGAGSVVAIDQSAEMLAGARARFAAPAARGRSEPAAHASPVQLIQAEAEQLPFRTTASTRSRSPTCCATWMTRLPRCASSRACCARGVGSRRSSSGYRRVSPPESRGAPTRPSACRCSAAWCRESGVRWGVFSGQHRVLLRAPPAGADRLLLARSRAGGRERAPHEPRRRRADARAGAIARSLRPAGASEG